MARTRWWSLRRRRTRDEPMRGRAPYDDIALTAAATALEPAKAPLKIRTEKWQADARAYASVSGEVGAALRWKAAAMSRVRLRAAKVVPGSDEPELLDDGPAVDLMDAFAGGIGGQAQLMKQLTQLLDVVGDSYLVGLGNTITDAQWQAYDPQNVKVEGRSVRVRVAEQAWAPVRPDAVIGRVYNADPFTPWLATSPVRSALHILREVDLYDRAITAILTSRIASNGLLVVPAETTLARGKNGTAPKGFVDELIDAAGQAISNPGSALAAMPLPIEVPRDFAGEIQHLTFSDGVSKDTIEARDRALVRLATSLDVPAEVLTGMADANHWTSWQIEASALKVNIAPTAETICDGITQAYLLPALRAAGEATEDADGTSYVVWYDTSELQVQPDVGEKALQLYDRAELSGTALRAHAGFDESDAPKEAERNVQLLMQMVRRAAQGQAQGAYELLTGEHLPVPDTTADDGGGAEPELDTDTGPATPSIPDTAGDVPEPGGMNARVIELATRIGRAA